MSNLFLPILFENEENIVHIIKFYANFIEYRLLFTIRRSIQSVWTYLISLLPEKYLPSEKYLFEVEIWNEEIFEKVFVKEFCEYAKVDEEQAL